MSSQRSFKKIFIASTALLLISSLYSSLYAETYSYIDENGTVNFTEDLMSIPKKFRKKAKRYDTDAATTASAPSIDNDKKTEKAIEKKATSSEKSGNSSDLYAGKSYDAWKNELLSQENELNITKDKIAEIDNKIKRGNRNSAELAEYIKERREIIDRYNKQRSVYEKIVDDAKKAGLKIELRKE